MNHPTIPSSVAYHEAGHAIADHVLGFEVRKVSIVPDGRRLGYAEHSWLFPDDFVPEACTNLDDILRPSIVVLLAGEEAQKLTTGTDHGSGTDWRDALDRAMHLVGDEQAHAILDEAQQEARALIKLHWAGLVAVAGELERQRELQGDDVRGLLEGLGIPAGTPPEIEYMEDPEWV